MQSSSSKTLYRLSTKKMFGGKSLKSKKDTYDISYDENPTVYNFWNIINEWKVNISEIEKKKS